jgi:hypothetical protein
MEAVARERLRGDEAVERERRQEQIRVAESSVRRRRRREAEGGSRAGDG